MTVNKITGPVSPLDEIDKINEIIDELGSGSVAIDDLTITKNTSDEIQTVAVKDNRTGNAIKTWTGTKAQYDALTSTNYTTVGSPTITSEGIAGPLSQSGYIKLPFIDFQNKSYSIKGRFKFNDLTTSDRNVVFGAQAEDNKLPILCFDRNHPRLYYGTNGSSWSTSITIESFTASTDTWYDIELIVDLTNLILKINGNTVYSDSYSGITYSINSVVYCVGANLDLASWTLPGYTDLNQLTVTVDGTEVYRAITKPDENTLYNTDDGLFLGTTEVADISEEANSRNVGEIVQSTIPLTDAGLHLLDGTLLSGSGAYADFVDYIASLYGSYVSWTQPTLSANRTMGGNTYACEASSYEDDGYGTYPAWQAFDDDPSTRWGGSSDSTPQWITFYSPSFLKVSNVFLNFADGSEVWGSGEILGSNDNSTWTTLATFSGNSNTTINISITTNDGYKYIRFKGTSLAGGGWGKVSQFIITAQQWTTSVVPNYFCSESDWQTAVTTYGVCGKFVYDSVNNTVRLPLIEGFTESTIDATTLGDLTEAGLPNITGSEFNADDGASTDSGCIYTIRSGQDIAGASMSGFVKGINASLSNPIYGNSTTVQPQSIKVLYYIVVATSTKTDIQVDIDEIATDLNMKVDKSSLSACHVVVETYQNGTSWYYVRDDKVCVQGGITGSTNSGVNITLLKPFKDTNYAITYGIEYTSGAYVYITNKTTTGFTITGGSQHVDWVAFGYIS